MARRERRTGEEQARATESEALARRARVVELNAEGLTFTQIRDRMNEEARPEWGTREITLKTVDNDVRLAREWFYENFRGVIEGARMQQYTRCEALYRIAYNERDVRAATMVMKRQAELLGLDAPKQAQVNVEMTKADQALLALFGDKEKEVVEVSASEVWDNEEVDEMVEAAYEEERAKRLF